MGEDAAGVRRGGRRAGVPPVGRGGAGGLAHRISLGGSVGGGPASGTPGRVAARSSSRRPNSVVKRGEVVGGPVGRDPSRGGLPLAAQRRRAAAWPASVTTSRLARPSDSSATRRTRPRSTSGATCRLTVDGSAWTSSASAPCRSGPSRTSGKSSTSAARSRSPSAAMLRLERVDEAHEAGQLLGERARPSREPVAVGGAGHGRSYLRRSGSRCTVQPVAGCKQQLHCTRDVIAADRGGRPRRGVGSWAALPDRGSDPTDAVPREEREPDRERPAGRSPGTAARRSRSPTSTGWAGGSTGCAAPATRRPGSGSASGSPRTSPPPRSASPAAGPPSRRSAIPTSCRSASGATTSPRRCGTTRWSSSPARPARARRPSCPRSPSSSAAAIRGRIGHTQPRRIAARSVAERIAEELDSPLGEVVGLEGAVHRPGRRPHAGQADDRRRAARRDRARPDAAAVRHDHPRRGPRAEPQHRLPAGLPRPAAAEAARPEAGHHLGDHRRRAGGRALQGRADRRGQRPRVPGGDPLPAGGRSRRAGGRPRPRPGQRDRRRRRRAGGRGAGRRPGVPGRRAGDPRHRRRAGGTGAAEHRDPAALLAAVGRRPAQGLRAAHRTPDRPGHQRRRDVADRARHQVRRRPGDGAHLAVQPSHQGAAAADRAGQPGLGAAAVGALRPHVRRHRDPALHRGRLRGPPRVHRPRDPAHQPRLGAAADGGPRPGRRRRLPVRRPAGPPRRRRRHRAARGAARPRRAREAHRDRPRAGRPPAGPADGPDGGRGERARRARRGAGHRRRPDHPGPARAARPSTSRPPTSCTPGSPTSTPTSSPCSTCGGTSASSRRC